MPSARWRPSLVARVLAALVVPLESGAHSVVSAQSASDAQEKTIPDLLLIKQGFTQLGDGPCSFWMSYK